MDGMMRRRIEGKEVPSEGSWQHNGPGVVRVDGSNNGGYEPDWFLIMSLILQVISPWFTNKPHLPVGVNCE